jgi:hypothetical protein
MTEERFEDLVNLYLDNEISRHELDELKRLLKENLARRKQFERACQLHQAARKALVSKPSSEGPAAESTRSTTGEQTSSRSSKKPTLEQMQQRAMVNATVPVMAERQMTRGAASSVNLSEVSSGRRRRSSSGGAGIGKRISVKAGFYLAGLMVAVAGWHFLLSPSQDSDDHYNPDVSEIPTMPSQDKGNPAADQLRSIADGGEFQPMSTQDVIQQRVTVSAETGNTVMQPFLVEKLSQSSTVVTENGSTTREWSMKYNEQLFFNPGNVNVSPPLPEQLKSASGNAPTLQSGAVPEEPGMAPGGDGIVVGPGSGAAPSPGGGGNNTGGKDLQP